MAEIPSTHYVKSDDVYIAYQVLGEGSLDLIFVPGFVSNVEAMWLHPGGRARKGRRQNSLMSERRQRVFIARMFRSMLMLMLGTRSFRESRAYRRK
jgi:hypothetical protein